MLSVQSWNTWGEKNYEKILLKKKKSTLVLEIFLYQMASDTVYSYHYSLHDGHITCKFHMGVKIVISKGSAYLMLICKTCKSMLGANAVSKEQDTGASKHSDSNLSLFPHNI